MASIPSNKTLAKAIVIFGSTQLLAILATIIRNKVAAETVGPSGVGLTSLYLSITSFVTTVVCLGLSRSSIQALSKVHGEGDVEKENELIGVLRLWEWLSGGLGLLVMLLCSPILCLVYFGHWQNHLHSIMLLSVVPLTGVFVSMETAILKSLQQTRLLTIFLSLQAIVSVVIAIPFYVLMGWDGIPYIISIQAIFCALIAYLLGHKATNISPCWNRLRNLKQFASTLYPMIVLGFAFIISGLCSATSELLMQSYINTVATLYIVGLYKSGYQFALFYPGMIFTAIDNDFFPRLTALGNNIYERNILIMQQIKILLLITTPCIICFVLLLPWIVPLLLSDEFSQLIPMISLGALANIFRAIYLPIAYMPLALGRSKDFIHLEVVSTISFLVFAIIGCKIDGLTGIGASFVVSQIFDLIYVYVFCKRKYRLSLPFISKKEQLDNH